VQKTKQPPNLVQHPPNGGYASQTAFKGLGSALNGFVALPLIFLVRLPKGRLVTFCGHLMDKVGSAGTELRAKVSFGMTDSTYI
jgi:hypothetical protein